MDFEHETQRLKRDQARARTRRNLPGISDAAKKEAAQRRRDVAKRTAEREKEKRKTLKFKEYYQRCEESQDVKSLSRTGSLLLQPTSIHGEGDKIALPPSVLGFLTESIDGGVSASGTSPWIFRIGILNPEYEFPASPLIKTMKFPDEDEMDVDEDSDDDDDVDEEQKKAYIDELRHKYLAFTHGTVVEFTQDEGYVGLPEPIANALLKQQSDSTNRIPVKRTVDPAKVGDTSGEIMDDEEKTPGHLAYGAFDIPDLLVEITMVAIPKGRTCTLLPTHEAIANGFYKLKDVKLVLEQSLVRTRATLSVGDVLHTWHRGVKFDLTVTHVTPTTYQTVTCINTDIEVEFAEVQVQKEGENEAESPSTNNISPEVGRTLGSAGVGSVPAATAQSPVKISAQDLFPEPPVSQKDGVCTVQIRTGAGTGRRRFDVNLATVNDLFAFAASVEGIPERFQLVSRFPRREFRLGTSTERVTMKEAGLSSGQELLMVEKL